MNQFNPIDFQFEEALVNLLAFWYSGHMSGDDAKRVPEIMYRLGWLLNRGMENYGSIGIGDLGDVLIDEARKRGYTETLDEYDTRSKHTN